MSLAEPEMSFQRSLVMNKFLVVLLVQLPAYG